MGTNENRDRKLAHHEKPIWRKTFEEAIKHTSIEGATRNAWKAVDAWNQAGAFNEETSARSTNPDAEFDTNADYREAFDHLHAWLGKLPVTVGPNIHGKSLYDVMNQFDCGDLDPNEFSVGLRSLL